jgi:hypothetical protein
MSKSKFQIKKVRRVLRLKSNDFNSATYNVWKVTGPNRLVKYFTTKKDGQAYIKRMNDNTITTEQLFDVMKGR